MTTLAEIRDRVHAEESRAGARMGAEARTERVVELEGITLRGTGADAPIKIAGHAAVFGRSTDIGGMFTETIRRGAFRDALDAHQDVLMLWDHDTRYPLARTANGTLKLREDPRGLETYAEVPRELSYARDLEVLIANRTIAGMSFGFTVKDDEWTERTADGKTTYYREIISVDRLLDVSPVAAPAYPTTDVGLRSDEPNLELELAELDRRAAIVRGYLEARVDLSQPDPEDEGETLATDLAEAIEALSDLIADGYDLSMPADEAAGTTVADEVMGCIGYLADVLGQPDQAADPAAASDPAPAFYSDRLARERRLRLRDR